tara:strand:- start:5582 stop:6322 length:741 start_codon:yes stop_codon:yes gene_type:complete
MQIEKDSKIKIKRLSSDENYYNNVFKKAEKIVSVIFYVVSETSINNKTESHLNKLKDIAFKTHELSLNTLSLQSHEQFQGLYAFQNSLVSLASYLKIANTAQVVTSEIHNLLADQLDIVQRYLNNHYLSNDGIAIDSLVDKLDLASKAPKTKGVNSATGGTRQRRVNIPAGDISTDAYMVHSQMTDRGERIKTVLEAKPQATIKDIAEVITDVSEKTIQRELNSLIEKGQVFREGERRWSRYSVSK